MTNHGWGPITSTPLADLRAWQEHIRRSVGLPAPGQHANPYVLAAGEWPQRAEATRYGYHVVNMVTGEHECPLQEV